MQIEDVWKMDMKKNMLVVLAHPDDESFPIGGTLAKYAAEGVRIVLATATRGEKGIKGLTGKQTAKIREKELKTAARYLGISRLIFLDYMDGEVAQVDRGSAIEKVKRLMREEQPDAVITFGADGISGHPDHVAIHELTTEALDQSLLDSRLFYILPSEATQQGCGIPPADFFLVGPTLGIDIGDYRIPKINAIQSHASQNPPFQGDPDEFLEKLACHEYFVMAKPKSFVDEPVDLLQ